MRVIEQQMINAISNGKNWRKSNTQVKSRGNWSEVYLFGSHIATVNRKENKVWMHSCGYRTATTKSRLNAIGKYFGGFSIRQHCGLWLVNNIAWPKNVILSVVNGMSLHTCEFPETLTDEEIRERERLKAIEREKNSLKAQIKHMERTTNHNTDWWSKSLFA